MHFPSLLAGLSLMTGVVSGVNDTNCSYIDLLKHLKLLNTNQVLANVRPVVNWTTVLIVKVDIFLSAILEVNEKSQTLTCQTWTSLHWPNEFLSWNMSDFCGIDRIEVDREKLWSPDILIWQDISDTGSVIKSPYVSVHCTGHVTVSDYKRLTTTCSMDLYKFPFDAQSCILTFGSMVYSEKALIIIPFSNESILNQLSASIMDNNGEWELVNITTSRELLTSDQQKSDQLIYTITVKRRPLLYVINLLLPLFYFLMLDLASYFVNEARGEKLGFKVTILLSISVLLLILNDILPSTAHYLPLIALYCIMVFILVGLSVLETILVYFLLDLDNRRRRDPNRGDHNHPQTQTSSSAFAVESRVQSKIQAEKGMEADASQEKSAPDEGSLGLSDPQLLQLALEEVQRVRLEASSTLGEGDQREPGYWGRVARRIDAAYFCLYCITITGVHSYLQMEWLG